MAACRIDIKRGGDAEATGYPCACGRTHSVPDCWREMGNDNRPNTDALRDSHPQAAREWDARKKLHERRRQYLESIPGYLPGRPPEDQGFYVQARLAQMPDFAVAALFASCKGEGE